MEDGLVVEAGTGALGVEEGAGIVAEVAEEAAAGDSTKTTSTNAICQCATYYFFTINEKTIKKT